MTTALQVFQYLNTDVRIQLDAQDAPWWVAQDVCDILEYADHRQALSRLDEDEKAYIKIHTPRGMQSMVAVNEFGLYTLVLGSTKPEAKRFKRWIAHEVLPALHRTGTYALTNSTLVTQQTVAALQSDIKALRADVAMLKRQATQKHVPRCKDCHRTISRKDWAITRLRKSLLCLPCSEERFFAMRRKRTL